MKYKRRIIPALLFCFATLLMFTDCSKQRIDLADYSTPDDFMYNNRPPEQEFVLTGDSGGGPIIGNQGTHLYVDSSIFMFPGGGDVSYPIVIKLIEIYQYKDMMLYQMPTVAQGKLLTTGGEFRVRAFKNNQELVLKPNKVYAAKAPSANPDPMMGVFYGKDLNSYIDWVDNPSSVSSNANIDNLEFITTDSGFYSLLIPVMGWINCDYFANISSSQLTNITLNSTTDNLTNVVKYLYFPALKSVMQIYGNVSGNVPVGENVKFICFAKNTAGALEYYTQSLTIVQNQTITVTMAEIPEADLLALMAAF